MSDNGKNGESPTVECAFELLDRWRHLPAYQLERRADIFFALFLPEVLEKCFCAETNRHLIVPEFPIKKTLIRDGKDNRSINIDYLALQKPRNGEPQTAFLIELKTDMASIKEHQSKIRWKLLN